MDEQREDRRQQPKPPKTQLLKPETATKKLSIYLPAAPEEFRRTPLSREQLSALTENPPEWLVTLRRDGPHPRKPDPAGLIQVMSAAGVAPSETMMVGDSIIDYRTAIRDAIGFGFAGVITCEHYGGDGLSVSATNRDYIRTLLPAGTRKGSER